jgi:hypothetical protein
MANTRNVIGKIEKAIMRYLAINTRQNKSQVYEGLRRQGIKTAYDTVRKGIDTLHQKRYLRAKKGESKKLVPIRFFSLADQGVDFVLSTFPLSSVELNTIIDNYVEGKRAKHYVREMHEFLGTPLTAKIFNHHAKWNNLRRKDEALAVFTLSPTLIGSLSKDEGEKLKRFIEQTMKKTWMRNGVRKYLKRWKLI